MKFDERGIILYNESKLVKKYGVNNARLITRRLNELQAMDSLGNMVKHRMGRCHALTGNLKGKYALDLDHPDRLIIRPVFDDIDTSEFNIYEVIEVVIEEVRDYHG